ncbi:MAG: DUF6020 family protein [Lachnospiraceae bacterium]|nr:DUF6020 family protein [Lachnospiraceae bacterium]
MKENIKQKNTDLKEKVLFVLSSLLAGFALTYRTTEALPLWAYGEVNQDFLIARIYSTLGDYQFDMIAASVLCGLGLYVALKKFAEYKRGIFMPLILSVIVVLGRSAGTYGDLSGVFGTLPFIIRSMLAITGYAVIFRVLFALLEAGFERVSVISDTFGSFRRIFGEKTFANVFIILMVLWLPIEILNFPGNYNADFIGQLMQNTGEMPWSGHHPIVLTLVIGLFFDAFKAVFGNYDLALFVWILIQSSCLAASLALTISVLKKKGARISVLVLTLSVYVLSPIYSNIATTAIKDVPFAAACIWYCVLVCEFYEDEAAFISNRSNVIRICLAAFFICMCRNNGSIIVFVNGLVMCVHAMKNGEGKQMPATTIKKVLLFLIVPLGVYTALSSGIKAATCAESDGMKEMLSIPMQQTALTLVRYEDELTPEEAESINALFGNYHDMIESYDPTISDPVKQYYDIHADSAVVAGYLKTWAGMFFKHPGTYFESFFLSTYGWFDPETDTSVRYEGDSELFTKTGLFEGADEILIFFYRYLDRISVFGMLQSPGLWTWIMLLLIRRRKSSLHLYPMQLITLLVCMAGPCFIKHARYAFPIMFTVPFMIGYEAILFENGECKKMQEGQTG